MQSGRRWRRPLGAVFLLEVSVVAPSLPPGVDLLGENLVPSGQAVVALFASHSSLEALPLKSHSHGALGGCFPLSLVLRLVIIVACAPVESSGWRWIFFWLCMCVLHILRGFNACVCPTVWSLLRRMLGRFLCRFSGGCFCRQCFWLSPSGYFVAAICWS